MSGVRIPSDLSVAEVYADAKALVWPFLTIGDPTAERGLVVQGRHLRHLPSLPSTRGNHASAVGADIVCKSEFCSLGGMIVGAGQMHNNSDRNALFHNSSQSLIESTTKRADDARGHGRNPWPFEGSPLLTVPLGSFDLLVKPMRAFQQLDQDLKTCAGEDLNDPGSNFTDWIKELEISTEEAALGLLDTE